MKKRIFTTLAIFAALALTACGGKPAESSEAGKESKPAASSKHVHTADENAPWVSNDSQHWKECKDGDGGKVDAKSHTWVKDDSKTDVPATCQAEGVAYEKCDVCGKTRERKLDKTEHRWDDGVATGNCGEAGKITYTCQDCSQTKEETSGYIPHSWEVTGSVEAGDGGLAYDLVKCTKCHKDGLMVKVKNTDGTNNMTVTGTPKTSPEGCVKLGAKNDYIMGAIKLAEAKTGKLYFRGSMDYWYTSNNQNEQKSIFSGKSGGGANIDNNKANFLMEVGPDAENLQEVTITCDHTLLYKDFLPEEVGFENVADTNWSQIGDVEIGDVSLQAGLNTLKFTRTDSYNCAIYGFVVAFDNAVA